MNLIREYETSLFWAYSDQNKFSATAICRLAVDQSVSPTAAAAQLRQLDLNFGSQGAGSLPWISNCDEECQDSSL